MCTFVSSYQWNKTFFLSLSYSWFNQLNTPLTATQRTRPARLVEGHLRLTLHSSLSGLGSLHAVLSKRRGKVVTDAMVDGTDLIQVTATIPQVESFVSFDPLLTLSCYLTSKILTLPRHHHFLATGTVARIDEKIQWRSYSTRTCLFTLGSA